MQTSALVTNQNSKYSNIYYFRMRHANNFKRVQAKITLSQIYGRSSYIYYLQKKAFREGGNLSEGKVNKAVFKRVMLKQADIQEPRIKEYELLFDALFERFKIEKFSLHQDQKEDDKIDIQDLVVSLTILARMDTEEKLVLIFQLTDVDEDGCLSIDDIFQMIKRIERNFSKETTFISNDSTTVLYELSYRKAQRKFTWATATSKLNKQLQDQKADDLGLIERKKNQDFLEQLKQKDQLFQNFLPYNYQLYLVLQNTAREKNYQIFESNKQEFDDFRREIHSMLRGDYKDKYYQAYLQEQKGIRYPGKVEIVKIAQNNEKQVTDVLPNFERNQDKKSGKNLMPNQKMQNSKQESSSPSSKQINNESDSNNNLEIHKKRLKEMEEKSRGWTLGFKNDKITVKK